MINFDVNKFGYPINRTSLTYGSENIVSNTELGKPSNYKFTDQSVIEASIRFVLPTKELTQEFMSEYGVATLYSWSAWFILPLQWNVDSGRTTRDCECSFNGVAPLVTKSGKRFIIDASILVRNPEKGNLDFYNAYLPLVNTKDPIDKLINRLEIFSNNDLPSNL